MSSNSSKIILLLLLVFVATNEACCDQQYVVIEDGQDGSLCHTGGCADSRPKPCYRCRQSRVQLLANPLKCFNSSFTKAKIEYVQCHDTFNKFNAEYVQCYKIQVSKSAQLENVYGCAKEADTAASTCELLRKNNRFDECFPETFRKCNDDDSVCNPA